MRNGSLRELRRGWRKLRTSSVEVKPFRSKSREMDGKSQSCPHAMGPPFSSSAGAMIHLLCTDYSTPKKHRLPQLLYNRQLDFPRREEFVFRAECLEDSQTFFFPLAEMKSQVVPVIDSAKLEIETFLFRN